MRLIKVYDLHMNYKALVVVVPDYRLDTELKGYVFNGYVKYLISYRTVVACIDGDGVFRMLVNPSNVSATTARHINRFMEEYSPVLTNWKKCEVFVPDGI